MTLPPTRQVSSPTLGAGLPLRRICTAPSPRQHGAGTRRAAYDHRVADFARYDFDEPIARFHERSVTTPGRQLWIPRLGDESTLVLGSTQSDAIVDLERAAATGTRLVRRRSGGGAVLVSSADVVWFDIVIDRDDPLWSDDVGRAFEWLGKACCDGLARLGHSTEMHRGAPRDSDWSKSICFAGVGSGELTSDGAKVVGISQRRTRSSARFQTAILRRWSPRAYLDLFRLDEDEKAAAESALVGLAAGVSDTPAAVLGAIIDSLP